ncbi:MAG: aminotransferase class V-fold PLP-dependent enzyme [Rickettsiales bacterium]|jgi:selenocysteine lyase/cysteine desulfurase|nr:aminotransferase class V-fold PLP-dependent enzyme [Rickettsiales bacterium]
MNRTIYADAAASALKPKSVIDAEVDFLSNKYANAGRGICARAAAADSMVSAARQAVANFVGAANPEQIVFTSGATDGLNRIARTLAGKTVIVSDLDHHSARLPFEAHCSTILAPLTEDLDYDWGAIAGLEADAMVITAMSNVLGVARQIPKLPFAVIVDASQFVIHARIDLSNVDYLVFSGHKIGADTGLGILYQKNAGEPVNFGGGMYMAGGAARFEAGTLPLTQIAGLKAALDEPRLDAGPLTGILREKLSAMPRIRFISPDKSHLIAFSVDGMHFLDFGAAAGARGLCLRVGHMCATWLHKRMGLDGSIRISLGPWNSESDIFEITEIIKEIVK